MNTNHLSHVMVQEWRGNFVLQKLFVALLILALVVASLPVRAAFAAPSGEVTAASKSFEQEWSDKIYRVRAYTVFYERVRVYPADFKDPAELAKAHDILNQYGVALWGAQRVITNRAGFDAKGRVVNDALADQSLKELSADLREMRILRARLEGLKGQYRLLPLSALNTTTSQ